MKVCRVLACGKPTNGYSTFCRNHKRTKERQGDPLQAPVTRRELASYRKVIQSRIEKNSDSTVWKQLEDTWIALVAKAEEMSRQYLSGIAYNRHEREAWQEILKIGQHVQPREVIEVALAMYLMLDHAPRRFVSDTAFGFQLVRRVRALAPMAMGMYYDHQARIMRSVYRDMKPRTTQRLAAILQDVFGLVGLTVAQLEQRDRQKEEEERRLFYRELSNLKQISLP